ncbi:MAG: hypothetical protein M1818_005200 [Claussenomyces sp. TS43310]|nr:MAG: hypothetical protein M1818_005200 [Claussenomyces sp. TS43310]
MADSAAGEGHWPPRSPHDALLSTPGGRDRLRRLAERTSPSPSPSRKSRTVPNLARGKSEPSPASRLLDDEDEDEETLQLRLQEIQARLKLKKLQKSKAAAGSNANDDPIRADAVPSRANSAATSYARQELVGLCEQRLQRSKSQASVHVPVSPTRRAQPAVESPRSPGRVLLGIDKGLKGSDVSLRRAPSRMIQGQNLQAGNQASGYLHRSSSQASGRSVVGAAAAAATRLHSSIDQSKPKTFSERIADVRDQEADRREKEARIRRARSKAFDISENEMEGLKKAAIDLPEIGYQEPQFSRDEVLHAAQKPSCGLLQRSKSDATLGSTQKTTAPPKESTSNSTIPQQKPVSRSRSTSSRASKIPSAASESETSEFETFSSLHLSKRIIPHTTLTRLLSGKRTFTIPDLLKDIKAPYFSLPDLEEDIVVLGIIAAKSEPLKHKTNGTSEQRGKFMVMTLTDLKWELELYLFDSGFDKFWKLTPGTVVAILNPNTMPPKQKDTGRFSLTLNSSEDTVLEIGKARDLGFCKSVKKDGKTCDAWIDKRHTDYCEYHINESLKKTKAGRMEVNTMDFGKGTDGERRHTSRFMHNWEDREKIRKERAQGIQYNRDAGKVYVQPGRRSAAALLDDVDVDPDAFHRGTSKEERMRRRLAEAEKERDIAKKLGAIGGGLGADYLRLRDQSTAAPVDPGPDGPPTPPDAGALGLLGGRAGDMHLSPIKRKRPAGRGSQSSNTSAIGWGGDLSKELQRMKEGQNLQPVKKKTRFITPNGIREAGRESFGGQVVKTTLGIEEGYDDDDDDDLDIIN